MIGVDISDNIPFKHYATLFIFENFDIILATQMRDVM